MSFYSRMELGVYEGLLGLTLKSDPRVGDTISGHAGEEYSHVRGI